MKHYRILEGENKGRIVRVEKGLGEIKTENGWEKFNAMEILFGDVESEEIDEPK